MDPMMEMFVFETNQNLEQLEQILIQSEKNGSFSADEINDIFRIMHTLKGSAAMMVINEVAALAHAMEDIFFYLRENKPEHVDCSSLVDMILNAADFIKKEIDKLDAGEKADGAAAELISLTKKTLADLKQANEGSTSSVNEIKLPKVNLSPNTESPTALSMGKQDIARIDLDEPVNVFQALITYQPDCEMENIRAYTVLNNLKNYIAEEHHYPADILEDETSIDVIRKQGFSLCFTTSKDYDEVLELLNQTIFLKDLKVVQLLDVTQWEHWQKEEKTVLPVTNEKKDAKTIEETKVAKKGEPKENIHQSMISVNVGKLDILMDLVGELVIAEAMVTQNPDLHGLELENFNKAARQLKKISSELQDGVMAIRMVPLTGTFQKMNRIVRDMSQKLNKTVELHLVGEETEVDKNVIEHISDPLMHVIRNSIDHGIELPEERQNMGKSPAGNIILEAKNAGSEVVINIVDDGKGFNREKILEKARANHLIHKNEAELTDREIYAFVFAPGFSTNEKVTEFSGRGVGMDVVMKNINAVGGNILANSEPGKGCSITFKIPLTLAIITGMNIRIGRARYTIPIVSIRESFKPSLKDIIIDPDGNEMVMVRGKCHPVVRLHELYHIDAAVNEFTEGIMVMVKTEKMILGLFADELLGQQQIVVKPIPGFIKNISKTLGITGCTLLGDGSISLILDPVGIVNRMI